MLNLTPQGQTLVQDLALQYAVSQDAVLSALQALIRGQGRSAQFDHPDLGGRVHWLPTGGATAGDALSPALKAKIDGLCSDLVSALAKHPPAESSTDTPGQEATDTEEMSLFIPDASRQTGHWWPFTLGAPSASGSQNDVSYAYFSSARRLAIEFKGHVTIYDTGDHLLSGLSQQPGDVSAVTIISQKGVFPVTDLPVVSSDGSSVPLPAAPSVSTEREGLSPAAASEDVIVLIERLAQLKDKGILTDEEFTAKKSELLRRL